MPDMKDSTDTKSARHEQFEEKNSDYWVEYSPFDKIVDGK